ncbi:MAG: hypothetical protein IPJ50_15385 [Betaproteobacteria bacterium]|nr:hypothetical protein [Betaproteobacteria bacterium]
MSALANLQAAKSRADAAANFDRFIASRQAAGWSASDVADYRESIRILMGADDKAALALFPPGTYQTAEQARQDAREHWSHSQQRH